MAQVNPFRSRHSEMAAREMNVFASTFGPEMLNVVPPPPFSQFYVIRSAPGAGKTSLMKALTVETLLHVHKHKSRLLNFHQYLSDFGVLDETGPRILGVLLNVHQGFLGLDDIAGDQETKNRLLFRLLDARLMSGVVRSAMELRGLSVGDDPSRVTIQNATQSGSLALERLGADGASILAAAEFAERELLQLLDRLIVKDSEMPKGHAKLYSLAALSEAQIYVDGERLNVPPLLMLDDGHALSAPQRDALLAELSSRNVTVGRWMAVRAVSLDDDELLGAGNEGRDYDVIEIEALTREQTMSGRSVQRLAGQSLTHKRFRKMLLDVADRRAQPVMHRILSDHRTLSELLSVERDSAIAGRESELQDQLQSELSAEASGETRYEEWVRHASGLEGLDGVARLSELNVLVARDKRRTQRGFFDEVQPLTVEEAFRRGSSSLREAALLRVSIRKKIPYYFGSETFARLGSANIEQFLELCGDATARVLQQDAAGRPIGLSAQLQDRIVRDASRTYWNGLAQLPDGDLMQIFVDKVGAIGASEAVKPTIPYPPGVTGTAISMNDRRRLRDPVYRQKMPGGELLFRALVSAIAHNVVWLELDYSVKNDRWMVVYLNRLLCPRYDMTLNLGGFRERKLSDMAAWFSDGRKFMAGQEALL